MVAQQEFSDGTALPLVEEFYSVQGEGYHTGKAAYFIRLGGCDIGCSWCDSRFSWDSSIHPYTQTGELVNRALKSGTDSVVITGGEPLMWNLDMLCKELKYNGLKTFLETSGAYPVSGSWDWICLSPKRNQPPLVEIYGVADELKVIVEGDDDFEWAELNRKQVAETCKLFLQPEWSRFSQVIQKIVDYVRKYPAWRISLQTHKYMHIP